MNADQSIQKWTEFRYVYRYGRGRQMKMKRTWKKVCVLSASGAQTKINSPVFPV